MILEEFDSRCNEILEYYGADSQIQKTIEECGELIVKLSKLLLIGTDRKIASEEMAGIAEEVADVAIMAAQMEKVFPSTRAWIAMKIRRTEANILETEARLCEAEKKFRMGDDLRNRLK